MIGSIIIERRLFQSQKLMKPVIEGPYPSLASGCDESALTVNGKALQTYGQVEGETDRRTDH